MILSLIHNIALLLTVSMLTDFFWKKEEVLNPIQNKIFIGLMLGVIVIIIMLTPWIFLPGVIFDTRSVLLGVSGFFFGWIPALIAAVFAITYRIILGGEGVYMGIAVIVFSTGIGVLWRQIKSDWLTKRNLLELYLLGLVIHFVMVGCIVFLPADRRMEVFRNIALPVLLIYPVFTLLFGVVLRNRKRIWGTKRALRESEDRFRVFFENNSAPTAIIEDDTTLSTVNEAFCRMTGYEKEEIIGTSWTRQIVPEDLERLVTLNQARHSGQKDVPVKYEFSYLTKSGERRQTQISIADLRELNRKIASFTDLTEIKLTEKQLIKAKESAEQSDRLKSSFLASMSHELRTPLNAIIGFSDMLTLDNDKVDMEKFGTIINQNGVQLLAIIESIFELALLQSKNAKMDVSFFTCDELFHQLSQTLAVELKNKKKNYLETEYLHIPFMPSPLLNCDKTKLMQLMANLLNNAIKYTERGKIEYGYLINNKNILFFVRDTGIGIPNDKLDIIFEKFRQVDDSHTRLYGGVGLGLSICKEIATMLNGKLWVESSINVGSTFYLELSNVLVEETELVKLSNQTMSIPDFSNKTILIVDDLDDNIFLLKKILESTAAKTLSAKSGQAAIQKVVDNPSIDLVLMDIKMPGMDGFIATAEIHKVNPGLPVVAQTAYAMKDDEENAITHGCVGYISKPIGREELFRKLQGFFQ